MLFLSGFFFIQDFTSSSGDGLLKQFCGSNFFLAKNQGVQKFALLLN